MDLSFSIVAKTVQAGWDKAKSLIGDLSKAFDGFAGRSAAHWAKFAAGAATAFAVVVSGARKMRDGVLRELEAMEASDIQFSDFSDRFNRKARMTSTQDEKDKLLESVTRERRDVERQYNNLDRREKSQDPLERIRDAAERKMNDFLGLGNKTDDERRLEALGNQLTQLRNKEEYVSKMEVSNRFDEFARDEATFNEEQNRVQDLENTTDALAKEAKALAHLEEAQTQLNAARDEFAKTPNDEAAEEKTKRAFALVQKLTGEWKSAAKAAEDYNPPSTEAREEHRRAWGGLMGGGDADPYEASRYAAKDYGPGMGGSLTKSNAGRLATRMKSSIGGHITDFSTPAYLARAMEGREGKTGGLDQQDPRLIEMKKQTKIQEELLKKTGAAP